MSGEYKGFRIWNLEFQATSSTGQNVVDDGNGRIHNSATDAIYWTESDDGLRSHLLDFLNPMIDSNVNGVGWGLDEDEYNKYYNIVLNNDPAYSEFIARNPSVWDAKSNPTGDKTIKLVPTSFVRVMCFKHTSGYKLMIGLSLYAMAADNRITSYTENTSYSKKIDPGFNGKHIYSNDPDAGNSNGYPAIGGLFVAMIPPPAENEQQDEWHLETSILDEAFFPPTMTQIAPMIHSNYISGNGHNNYYCSSWLKLGSGSSCTAHNAGNNSGVAAGTNMKLSLMLDTKANVCISYKYTAATNTTSLNPMIFIGPIYKKKIYNNDTLCTKNLGIICVGICGNKLSSGTDSNISAYNNAAWLGAYSSSYYTYFTGTDYGASPISNSTLPDEAAWFLVGSFNANASSFVRRMIYSSFPAVDSNIYMNFRYAKAAYTDLGLIDEDVFRWSKAEGLVRGQTYNDKQWVFIGSYNNRSPMAQNSYGTTSDWNWLYLSIKWDGEFNDTKTFA